LLENSNAESEDLLVRQQSLVDQVFGIINERIISEFYPSGSKLPAGDQLAEELNVSRSTIRMAMSKLEDRNLVQRRQGVGTYIRELTKIPNPLNEFIEFTQLIKDTGYQPGYSTFSEIIEPDAELQELLRLGAGSLVLEQRKIFTADGDPFIYVVNQIPVWVFENVCSLEESLNPGLTERFVEFFEITCNQKISHFVSSVRADIYENIDPPRELVNDGPNTPVLVINETGFNEDDKPIIHSCEFHPGNWMTFKMIRRLSSNK
jgi:GntR family transcriptional regulator